MSSDPSLSRPMLVITLLVAVTFGAWAGALITRFTYRPTPEQIAQYDFIPIEKTGGLARVDRVKGEAIFLSMSGKVYGSYPELARYSDAELRTMLRKPSAEEFLNEGLSESEQKP